MKRVESLTAWFCSTLGVTLLGVTVLIVPEQVFADANSDCSAACCTGCFGTGTCNTLASCWTNCQGTCTACEYMCGSNATCKAQCLTNARATNCPSDALGDCEFPGRSCPLGLGKGTCGASPNGSQCTCK